VKHGHVPDLVLASPSRRTRQTWHSVAVALANAGSPTVRYERDIYDGSAADLLKVLQQSEPAFQTIMMVGHNPSISQLSEMLDPSGEADSDGLRTCGIAIHEVDTDWTSVITASRTATHTARAD
jgi:phosphohistidine phosphatase